MTERSFLKWLGIRLGIVIGVIIAAMAAVSLFSGHELTEEVDIWSLNSEGERIPAKDLTVSVDPAFVVEVVSMEDTDTGVSLTLVPVAGKKGLVEIGLTDSSGTVNQYIFVRVSGTGIITDMSSANFSNYRVQHALMVILLLAISGLLWAGFLKSYREMRFSYHSIFCVGLAIWTSIITVLVLVKFFQKADMLNTYGTLQTAATRFGLLTFPAVFIFAVLLTISNIRLIQKEMFRVRNALGIILSLIMVGGFVLLLLINEIFTSGTDLQMRLFTSVVELLESVYAILECFLIGAVICGTLTAKNQPAFDKDYIVILGCKIKPDGTLYPLIKSRVDRAIRFYREQLEATGKKAIFVPSGGQGSNEVISEGEAMKRYLLEQGFTEDQIIAETASKNTRQNMEFSMALIPEGKKAAFSTTNFHVFRSGIIARQVGFDADGMGSSTKWYFWPNAYVREVIGMMSYKWKALVLVFIPIGVFLTVIRFIF